MSLEAIPDTMSHRCVSLKPLAVLALANRVWATRIRDFLPSLLERSESIGLTHFEKLWTAVTIRMSPDEYVQHVGYFTRLRSFDDAYYNTFCDAAYAFGTAAGKLLQGSSWNAPLLVELTSVVIAPRRDLDIPSFLGSDVGALIRVDRQILTDDETLQICIANSLRGKVVRVMLEDC